MEYTITVTNTGNVTLTDLTITDTFTDGATPANNLLFDDNTVIPQLTGSTDNTSNSTTLNVGETKTYTATYTVEESAAATGSIENQVFVQARSPESATLDVNDLSDDPSTETAPDDKTIVSTEYISDIKATKTYSVSDINNDNKTGAGDQVSYTVTVENTGNTVLDSLVISDTFKNGDEVQLYFDSDTDPTNDLIYVSSSINDATIIDDVADQGVLLVGEVETYTVVNNYTITAVDEESGRLINTVTVTAKNSEGEVVEDVSDNGIPGDGNEEDDETIINFAPNPELRVTKVDSISVDVNPNGNGPEQGDTIFYTITIENTGNVTLSGVTPTDEIRDGDGVLIGNLQPDYVDNYIGDNADIASSEGILISGERAVYTATYQITQEVEETGFVSNVVTVTANGPDDVGSITAVSDDPDTEEGGDPTVTQMHASPNMTVVKTASVVDGDDQTILAGDLIQFNITITNTGNVDLIDLTLEDTLNDGSGDTILTDGSALLPTLFSGSDQDSPRGTLKVGETATYLAYLSDFTRSS